MRKFTSSVFVLISTFWMTSASAAPSFSQKVAWCNEKTAALILLGNYERQKALDECMRTADKQILEYEQNLARSRENSARREAEAERQRMAKRAAERERAEHLRDLEVNWAKEFID